MTAEIFFEAIVDASWHPGRMEDKDPWVERAALKNFMTPNDNVTPPGDRKMMPAWQVETLQYLLSGGYEKIELTLFMHSNSNNQLFWVFEQK